MKLTLEADFVSLGMRGFGTLKKREDGALIAGEDFSIESLCFFKKE